MKIYSGCLELSANNQLSTLQKTSLFLELFSKMNKIIDEKYPKSGTQFSQFRGAIRIKMQLLELIKNRYIVDATRVEKCFKIAEKKLGLYATSADQRVLKEADEFSRRFEVANMLSDKISYSKIEEKTKMSSTTIARISKFLK